MKPIQISIQISLWGLLLLDAGSFLAEEPKLDRSSAVSKSCPREIEPLAAWMLQDLPSYANRVIQRSRRVAKGQKPTISIFIAGKPEFEPLTLDPGIYLPRKLTEDEELRQVFFTAWESSYRNDRIVEFQEYNWAFLTYTKRGWRLAALYSSLSSYPSSKPPTPIRESSEGVLGRGIKLWLRDCAVGKVRSRNPIGS